MQERSPLQKNLASLPARMWMHLLTLFAPNMQLARWPSVTPSNLGSKHVLGAMAWGAIGLLLVAASRSIAEQPPDFEHDVAPILIQKCSPCHGDSSRKADLDLRTLATILRGGESGSAVVPGQLSESLLWQRIEDGTMPPAEAPDSRLTASEVETIRRWIAGGVATSESLSPAEHSSTNGFHQVLPILLRHCAVCHGARVREADLDLHTWEGIVRGGRSGPIIVPGNSAASRLVQRMEQAEMPPLTRLIEVSVKPVDATEVATIRAWIDAGASPGNEVPDVAGEQPDPLVTEADRSFWSFRPPRSVRPPLVQDDTHLQNPIDAFIQAKLESQQLGLSPEADRPTLIRRVSLDLIGLPPTPDEVSHFVHDTQPYAYERLVDRLLSSPHYGERWGRIWLDLAGYADSDGKREQDLVRPFAWRYRDYVIKSWNRDKPYDQFLVEQLAGDELADYAQSSAFSEQIYDNLVATGFMRMAPDATWRNVTNFVPDRIEIIADQIDILASSILGLTLKCARCHTHKFDPIPQRDYYRVWAVFKGAYDEYDWLKSNWHPTLSDGQRLQRDFPYAPPAERANWEAAMSTWQAQAAACDAQLAQPGISAAKATELRAQRMALDLQRPAEPTIRALWDRGDPSPTYLYRRGEFHSPGRLIGPGVPSVLTDGKSPFEVAPPWPGARSTGRRLAFARWLTQANHPLTARVLANRLWRHHFGQGLVKTLDNFGKTGARPTHPELLDWLAQQLTSNGWNIKRLQYQMVTSGTYRQTSHVSPASLSRDPDNLALSRMPLQRLTADQLYDSLLAVALALDSRMGGTPSGIESRPEGLVLPMRSRSGWRRSIYVQQQRKAVVTQLETFDFPAMNPHCSDRNQSTVALQALHLWNNGLVQDLAHHFAQRVYQQCGDNCVACIELSYQIAFGRHPTAAELSAASNDLRELAQQWQDLGKSESTAKDDGTSSPQCVSSHERALDTWCHLLLNSAEFLYVD